MTAKKASNEIKQLLDELLRARTHQEKKNLSERIKPLLAIIEAPIKKLAEEKAADEKKKRIIKNALRELISTLDKITGGLGLAGGFCEQASDVIHHCFLKPQRGYSWPAKFGMDSDIQEEHVRAALQKFLAHPEVMAASKSLKTPECRLLAFQDDEVKTRQGNTFFNYFGYINRPLSHEEIGAITRKAQH
jgi:hypothetical protein